MEEENEEPTELKEVIEREITTRKKHKTLEEHTLSNKIMIIGMIIIIVIVVGILALISTNQPSEVGTCGDGKCDSTESCSTCEVDCMTCPTPEPYCGDGSCQSDESCSTCSEDCGGCPTPEVYCGDGTCEGIENCLNCPEDCGECPETPSPMPQTTDCLDCINVYELKYDAPGDDCMNLNGEQVIFRNRCEYDCDLTGWTVGNRNNRIYTFPNFVLGSKEKVTLYTGKGADTENRLYWNSKGWSCNEIWKNNADTVFLKDSEGNVALVQAYW